MEKELSTEEFEYYSRQLALADIGYTGQIRLRDSKVVILGCGGIGVPGMLMLTAMGVGHLRIVDRDIISISDLHRQYIYDAASVGGTKVEVAAEKLRKLNPNVIIEPFAEPIIRRNVSELIEDMDLVVDALDSMETRYLVNRACYERKVPYIFAGAIESIANASTIIPDKTPCLECLFPGFEDSFLPKCSLVGVHPAVTALISSIQVSEAVTILTGRTPKLAGKLLLASLSDLSFDKVEISRSESCPVCGTKRESLPRSIPEKYFEEECARDGMRTFVLTPKEDVEIDLGVVSDRLQKQGVTIKSGGILGITFDYSEAFTLSFLKSGTMIVQVSPARVKRDLGTEILSIYRLVMVDWLRLPGKIVPDSTEG